MLVELVAAEIIDAAGGSASAEQFCRHALEQVRRAAPCDSILFLPATPDVRPVAIDRRPTMLAHYRQNLHRYWGDLQLGRDAGRRLGAYFDLDVFSAAHRQKSAFFSEIIAPQRLAARIVTNLEFRGRPLATIHLCADSRPGSLRRGLESVRALSPVLSLAYAAVRSSAGGARIEELGPLTPHQRRIALYVSRGYQNKEIAALLQISPFTVRNQLATIFKKTGAVNRAQLAALVRPA